MSRRKSRIVAFQGLYSWEVGGINETDVLQLEWTSKDDKSVVLDAESSAFARMLIGGTIENIAKIDDIIKNHLTNWTIERVNKVTLSILRMSIYCLMFTKDVDSSIIIDEAIDIAKNYGTDDSYKFVNAILDSINKELKAAN